MRQAGQIEENREATASIGRLRLAIGFLQGVLGWLLLRLVPPVRRPARRRDRPRGRFARDAHAEDQRAQIFRAR